MKYSGLIKEMIRDFLLIFASIMIIIAVLRQIFAPDASFELDAVFTIMGFSFLGALTGILLYTPHPISEKQMRLRVVFHFFFLETLLISLAVLLNLVYTTSGILLLALQIAAVYAIVRLLTYRNDKKEARKINERLKAFKSKL
ncbi:hypothetical protein J41TS12_43670 [Paenibacillus antibioticophila]|uniref:DUF3021 domain-containing protein n=1 Tax=Paenibacillus antibioticophila TaxID=1274374 RepID=A0A920CGN2_9BACL|nr:DUF3021 family protein [Paenibacillus antibioticophila]GIO39506.1 hypothetical protein J41TS12_43670 [Paenibacillus antibioticophila]